MDLSARAILVSLRISAWTARRYDKKISGEVASQHGTDERAGRYNKRLMVDAPEYKELSSFVASARVWNYQQTLVWDDEGWRMLPMDNYDQHTKEIRAKRREFERLLERFLAVYDDLVDTDRRILNGMFNHADYPTTKQLRRKYSFDIEYTPVPQAGDIRVTLTQEEHNEIARCIEDRVKRSEALAHQDAVDRLRACVQHISEKLSDPKGIFRDTLVLNARELCDVLKRLNVCEDPSLDYLRERVETLAQHEPETLREDEATRAEVADEASRILAAMNAAYGNGGVDNGN